MFGVKLMKGGPKLVMEGLDRVPRCLRMRTEHLEVLISFFQHAIPCFRIPLPVQSAFHALMIHKP